MKWQWPCASSVGKLELAIPLATITRLIDTFKIAAEESVRIDGEVLNLEISPRAKGYRGFSKRVPIGPCSFISPFNFPLNLAAHKVAPALAVGCPSYSTSPRAAHRSGH